ncbi:MAG: periplasmic heavy metal sensor [Oleispira antarctica]|nr:periplasmic heavy metal sensor [Oleispira antarctica]MBQ0792883.1 periplasmic heavy metal sensor [Oleispira antarctica]
MNKKMKTFISLSVFLNVLLVGIILGGVSGGFSKHHFDRGHKSEQMEQRLSRILAVLPAEKNALFKQRLNELKVLKRTDKEQMKLARRHIMQVFEQEPFDKVAYQQAVQALNQLHQTQMDKRVSLLADVGEYLSPKERRQLSRLIMKRGERK